jgi:hypothetical protein
MTYKGTSSNTGPVVWKSGSSDPKIDFNYFLGLDCTNETVSIYTYIPTDPGRAIWNSLSGPWTLLPPIPSLAPLAESVLSMQSIPFNGSALEYSGFL